MKMTNKQFCARLRDAKKIAVYLYPQDWCIYDACKILEITLGRHAIFDKRGVWQHRSKDWVCRKAKSSDDISAVFDNSIRALGEEP